MRRSARSIPTGPGSRGGHWHDPEYRRAYFRAWRAAHPDYRERNIVRCSERRHDAQLERDRREVELEVARLTRQAIRPLGDLRLAA